MPLYTTGPIEQEPGVTQLRLKVLNDSNVSATATATIFDLDGTKRVFRTINFPTLPANSSNFAIINIPNLFEFEVQFNVSNVNVFVAVFAVRPLTGTFSATNSVRHGEMVLIS